MAQNRAQGEDMRPRIGSVSHPANQQNMPKPAFKPNQNQGQRSRSGGRQTPPNPAFHKDHPWVKAQQQKNNQQGHQQPRVQVPGNGQGQGSGAVTVQNKMPQVSGTSTQSGASTYGPFTSPMARPLPATPTSSQRPLPPTPSSSQSQRSRTYSQATSEGARRTVMDSITQQASTGAQIAALSETNWRQRMELAFGTSTSASSASSSVNFQLDGQDQDQEAQIRGPDQEN